MSVTFSTDKLEVKIKEVSYFNLNMTCGVFVLHIAKSQEFVACVMSCLFSENQIRAKDLETSQPRPPSPLPPPLLDARNRQQRRRV